MGKFLFKETRVLLELLMRPPEDRVEREEKVDLITSRDYEELREEVLGYSRRPRVTFLDYLTGGSRRVSEKTVMGMIWDENREQQENEE